MKILPTVILSQFQHSSGRRNLKALSKFLFYLSGLVVLYSILFHYLMAWEGRQFS